MSDNKSSKAEIEEANQVMEKWLIEVGLIKIIPESILVNGMKIAIEQTEKYLYFRDTTKRNPKPQAIWHKVEKRWIKCHCEFGDNFKAQIKSVLGL